MTRVVVVGDALLDRDVVGRVERVCPDAPVPVVDVEAVLERPGGAALAAALDELLAGADAVLVADYGGPVARHPSVREALGRHVARVPVVWDPHPRGQAPVPGVAVVTPNRAEATAIAGAGEPGEVAERLRRRWSAAAVIVTDGERGAVTAQAGGPPVRTPAPAVRGPVDACGAGDRFAAAVA